MSSGTAACGLGGAEIPAPRWAIGGGVTHSSRHDRALPRAVTRLPIELAIVSLEQVSLVQDKADLAQQVKGRWRGGIG